MIQSVIFVGRYYALYSYNCKLEVDESKYKQLRPGDVRMVTDAEQRWSRTSQPAFAAEPQYCLYDADNNAA